MEKVNQRRSFLKGAGIVSAFVVGVASYKQVKEIADENKDISHLAPPPGATTLQITGSYGEPPKPLTIVPHKDFSIGTSSYYIAGIPKTTHRATMTVGKDNRLWIQVGDEWRRVALEG